ncbi:hypothetical protein [Micromonospora sp. KC213]|nr:hypothetical protein [Micromonospora sp. KC213]
MATVDEVRRLRDDLTTAIDNDRVAVLNVIGAGIDVDGCRETFRSGTT